MNSIKGDRLYVNLSASQVRRRLKGFGHGVRKIQSAGRNQAVIIHTATGRHLEELESVLADGMPVSSERELGVSVESLRNIGPTSAAWLREIGVASRADLEELGPALAYQLVKKDRPDVSLNLLWALAAGLADIDWRNLTENEKAKLKSETDTL